MISDTPYDIQGPVDITNMESSMNGESGIFGGYNVAYGVQLDKMEKNAVSAWDAGEIWGNAKNRMKYFMKFIVAIMI